jgi:NAD(P)H-flavin reductase
MESYRAGIATPPRHLHFQKHFSPLLPANHPNVDKLLANPNAVKLPLSHPDLDFYVTYRSRFRPGHLLSIFVTLVLILSSLLKLTLKAITGKPKPTEGLSLSEKDFIELCRTRSDLSTENESITSPAKKLFYASNDGTIAPRDSIKSGLQGSAARSSLEPSEKAVRFEKQELIINVEGNRLKAVERDIVVPTLDMMQYKAKLQQIKHNENDLYEYHENLPSLPSNQSLKERNLLKDITSTWQSRNSRSIKNLALGLMYIALNAAALLYQVPSPTLPLSSYLPTGLAPFKDLSSGFGSLAIANSIILLIPTTSLGIWLGLDGTYHKSIGIWTFALVLLHLLEYIPELMIHLKEHVYWTGISSAIGLVIVMTTSFDFVRLNHFKWFWYGHFVGSSVIVFAFAHVQECRPFIAFGAFVVSLDSVWKLIKSRPQKPVVFENKSGSVAVVRLRNQGVVKPGQYYFVNVPKLSITEWTLVWVSSGPRENELELCVRAQNEFTLEIVKHSRIADISGKLPLFRIKGPFGGHDLNFRNYPVLILAGGGDGIGPIVSLLKDIYHVGKYNPPLTAVIPHYTEAVYLVWAMPNVKDATIFNKELQKCINNSSLTNFPPLLVWIYITKSVVQVEEPMIAGRPEFASIFNIVESNHPGKSTMIFASGPPKMVCEVYGEGIKREASGSRVDFEYTAC